MNGKLVLYIDQYGERLYARSARELQRLCGGRLFKIYRDKKDGSCVHCGYGVGRRWFNIFLPYEAPA